LGINKIKKGIIDIFKILTRVEKKLSKFFQTLDQNFLNSFIQKREKAASLSSQLLRLPAQQKNVNFGYFLSELWLLKDKPSSKSVRKAWF